MPPLPPDACYSFVFAAPAEAPWGLTFDAVEQALTAVDPQAYVTRRPDRLSFEVTFPFGWVEGGARTAPDTVRLRLVTIDQAAQFTAWLRTRLLPPTATIQCLTFEAVELDREPITLPDGAHDAAVLTALTEHVRDVQEEWEG